MKTRFCLFRLCLSWFLTLHYVIDAYTYGLRVAQNLDGCRGGEICDTQPIITVINARTQETVFGLSGSVYVQIGASPSGYESLYIGQDCDHISCGQKVIGTLASATFFNGQAMFQDLALKTAGSGYTLKFTGRLSSGDDFAQVFSDELSVAVGDPYKLAFQNYIGTAFGGSPFAANPVVGVVDRGDNVVDWVSEGTVSAALTTSPTGEEALRPAGNLTVEISEGLAEFVGLHIREAGYPYRITFNSSLDGLPTLESAPFDVAVGQPAAMTFVNGTQPSASPKFSGEFFAVTPRVELRDAGGNLVASDSTSAVRVSLFGNPTGARLGLAESLFPVALSGVVSANSLRIDRHGRNYTLLFSLHSFSALSNSYSDTGVSLLSEKFDALLGPPRRIAVKTPAGGAWAGNQAMSIQPVVRVTDYGGNVLADDHSSLVRCRLAESLSFSGFVSVDTSNASVARIASVGIDLADGAYGAGQVLLIRVNYAVDVWLEVHDELFLPHIELNIANAATAEPARAYVTGPRERVRTLTFRYEVAEGDSAPALDFAGQGALSVNASSFLRDGNHRAVDTTLPLSGLVGAHSVAIDTARPTIVLLGSDSADGEYGEGDSIDLFATFDKPVAVEGAPYVELSATFSLTVSNLTQFSANATYTHTSADGYSVHFAYAVGAGHSTPVAEVLRVVRPSILFANSTLNTTVVRYWNLTGVANASSHYNYTYDWATSFGGSIRRLSDRPTTLADCTLSNAVLAAFDSSRALTVDTSRPALDSSYGVRTDHGSGTFYPGEHILLTVRFTRPVAVRGNGIFLMLDCGPRTGSGYEGFAFVDSLLADNVTLQFLYVAERGTNCSRLDLVPGGDSLRITQAGAFIRHLTASPATDADLSTQTIHDSSPSTSLGSSAAIALQGFSPAVADIFIQETSPPGATVLRPDDSVLIRVNFTGPVFASCPPVLVVASSYLREAVYVSGNLTNSLLFRYTVQVGDAAQNSTSYRNTPYALCPVSGCPVRSQCTMLAHSTQPSQPVNLRLNKPFTAFDASVRIGNQTILPVPLHRSTNISSIRCLRAAGVYGPGSVFRFRVEFSDAVQIHAANSSLWPRLLLNTGRFATYSGGNHGHTLSFTYISASGDVMLNGDPFLAVQPVSGTQSVLSCLPMAQCNVTNQAGHAADLTTTTLDLAPTGITLDATPPIVTAVWSDKAAAPYDSGAYSVGEVIVLFLRVSRPVLVGGLDPRILLDVGVGERYAHYSEALSSDRVLAFQYVVGPGESTADLRYAGSSALDLRGGNSEILLRSDLPGEIALDPTLPGPGSLSLGGHDIAVDTLVAPAVTNVVILSPSGRYAAGDVVTLRVDFSKAVVAEGHSYLTLNAGDRVGLAHYVGCAPLDSGASPLTWTVPSQNTPSNATKHLFYQYSVGEDHFSADLAHTDPHALFLGLTDNNDRGYIRDAATVAKLPASLVLPAPGSAGSLAIDGVGVLVDGSAPYVVGIRFVSPDGVYGTGDSVLLAVNFSAPVVLLGPPPSILMETGEVDNEAAYLEGNATSVLTFLYSPQPGDRSPELDYHARREQFNSAVDTFQLNGGRVLAASAQPFLPASTWLNPPRGELRGTSDVVAVAGEAVFDDLMVSRRGRDYLLRYSTESVSAPFAVTATQPLEVSFSSEFLLWANQSLAGQLWGHAVSLEGDLAVMGAPNTNRSVTTKQAITSSAVEAKQTTMEVQVIGTSIASQPAIQSFHTTADVGATVSGTFTVSYGDQGPSSPIPFNADPAMVSAILAFDIPALGKVVVDRQPHLFCACSEAYAWSLTFVERTEGDFGTLTIDAANLAGSGAAMVGPTTVQNSALLGGTFTLGMFGRVSSPIAYDAGVRGIADALAEIGLAAYDVLITPSTAARARTWSVTFGPHEDSYELPVLVADGSGLTGGATSVWTDITRMGVNGPRGIGGYFQLQWRGNTTAMLRADASAAEVKHALEALPVINEVAVNRSHLSAYAGYTWTVEFVSVNAHTPRGYVLQDTSNLEPIVPISHLVASNVSLVVAAVWEIGSRKEISSPARAGSYGSGAGAVAVFQRDSNESWIQVASLVGNDTAENGRFGGSVAQSGDVILVGAVGASMNGQPEKQSIFCSADSGYFRISFRGWSTDLLPFNVTRLELEHAIVSNTDSFSNLYSVVSADVGDWGGGGLCANRTAVITFYAPVDGNTALFAADTGADLELLTLTNWNLTTLAPEGNRTAGALEVATVQDGTWVVHGSNADKQQIGAVYVFRAQHTCDPNSTTLCVKSDWAQEAQLFPSIFQSGSRYGAAVAVSGDIAVVGAPGTNREQGYAYVYEYSADAGLWELLQVIRDPTITSGDQFGSALAIDGWTMVIGAPHYDADTGALYVFRRSSVGGLFSASQTLLPAVAFPLSPGDLFGSAVSVSGGLIAVGAPQFADTTVYLGRDPSKEPREKSGAVFVFERSSAAANFLFLQKLRPSNVRAQDRFGASVNVDGTSVVASSLESFIGPLPPAKAIVEIRSQATYNRRPVGGSFKLKWLTTNSSDSSATYLTRAIPFDVAAPHLKVILQEDLPGVGELLVSRSQVDQFDGGYSWRVTFAGRDGHVDLLEADTSLMTGTNASVAVRFVNPSPLEVRGLTHFFQRDAPGTRFVEQLLLSPHMHQAVDRCGQSVAVSGKFVLVGCPNRDRTVPNHNSGAAFMFHLGLATVRFSSPSSDPYRVTEGQTAAVTVEHDEAHSELVGEDVFFTLQTVDRNALERQQTFLRHLYGLTPATFEYPRTVVDTVGLFGLAVGRSQSYGSGAGMSRWADGMYDYRAVTDYVPVSAPRVLLREASNVSEKVHTAADTILEWPHEQVGLAVSSPGVWPGAFSQLYSLVEIQDDGSDGFALSAQFSKLYDAHLAQPDADYAAAVAVCEDIGVMVTGAPLATVDGVSAAGKVFLYREAPGGGWAQLGTHISSPLSPHKSGRFGEAVALVHVASRNVSILAVGEPGINSVHLYLAEGPGVSADSSFVYETTLSAEAASLPQHGFGRRGTVGLDGFLLAVGAPGLETVYTYRRAYSEAAAAWQWAQGEALRSLDYDEDVLDTERVPHRQGFGSAVAVSARSVLVGAPHADYDKLGSDLVERGWSTEGTDILAYGRGKAYVFHGTPAEVVVRIVAPEQLLAGQFRLQYAHQGANETTEALAFDAREAEMAAALGALSNIDSVRVSAASSVAGDNYQYTWTVTFNADWTAPGKLVPLWRAAGCGNCTEFSFLPASGEDQVTVTVRSQMGPFVQLQALRADDRRNGDRFGWAVAMDGNQIAVGAPYSAALTTTTWDFEAGTLLGWRKSGSAFDLQPTFADNSYLHSVQGSSPRPRSQAANSAGRYYIGTAERRPGNPADYSSPHPAYPQGGTQGDGPTGTLSSAVFMIPAGGTRISFLVGGGCDIYTEFVELLVDGLSVAKRTGLCSEKMAPAHFDVSSLAGRAAQIRIVDASSGSWGHINADTFSFDWDVAGATVRGAANQKVTTGGVVETPRSGAMYLFRRRAGVGEAMQCDGAEETCVWSQEAVFTASDKRANTFFGDSVAVNDAAGIVAVGAPGAALRGFYKEAPSVFPHQNASTGASLAAGIHFPVAAANMPLFQSEGVYMPERSGAFGVWALLDEAGVRPDPRAYEESGAVYVFVKSHATVSNTGVITEPQTWRPIEHAKLQPPDAFARDHFGASVCISGTTLSVGAPGQDGAGADAGAAYVYRAAFAAISFSEIEYAVSEGRNKLATVTLLRDPAVYSGRVVLEYATSDLTARGVDSAKFDACMALSVRERGPAGCGDYEQSAGLVVIEPGDMSGGFTVRVLDDLCFERFSTYLQVTLSVPGSAALQSERLSARVRIDDNDFGYEGFC